jgi:hypothetical protein
MADCAARARLMGGISPNPRLCWTGASSVEAAIFRDTSVTAERTSACATTTYSGRPYGPPEFVEQMEEKFGRHWRKYAKWG